MWGQSDSCERHEAGRQHQGLELGGLLPGIKISTSADDFAPIKQMQLQKFQGDTWLRFGDVIAGEGGG